MLAKESMRMPGYEVVVVEDREGLGNNYIEVCY